MARQAFNVNNMSLYSILRDVLHRLWIVVIAAGIGTMITFTVMKQQYIPEFTSTAIYVISPRENTGYVYTNKQFASNISGVLQNLVNADIMVNRIQQDLKKSYLTSTREVSLIEETNLVKITVTSRDAIESYLTIDSIIDNYYELSEYINSNAVLDELKAPVVARTPNNSFTPRTRSLQVGGLSALAMLLILVMLSMFRKTIKTVDAAEDNLEITVLGTVFHEQKNKTIKAKVVQSVKSLLITSPIISRTFLESFNNIRMKLEYEIERNQKNVFMITSVCENEGKSTVALNIALSLAKEGKKVMLIDADMRKPAIHKMLDIKDEEIIDMINLLQGKCGLDAATYSNPNIGLDIVMSSKGHDRTHEYIKSGAMRDLIHKASQLADYVIIDTPPMGLVSDTEALLDVVDFTMLVIRQDFSYERDVMNVLGIINDSHTKFVGCILNDFRRIKISKAVNDFAYNVEQQLEKQKAEKVVEVYDE